MESNNFSNDNPFQSGKRGPERIRPRSRSGSRSSSSSSSSRRSLHSRGKPRDEIDEFFSPQFTDHMYPPKQKLTPSSFKSSIRKTDYFNYNGSFPESPLVAKTKRMAAANLSRSRPHYSEQQHQDFYGDTGGFKRHREIQQPILNQPSGTIRRITIATLIIFGVWYRQERFMIGFCTEDNISRDENDSWSMWCCFSYGS
jgi:hypothetical protein